MSAGDQVTLPLEDRVGPDQQPQTSQGRPRQRVQQRGQPRPIHRLEPNLLPVELALQQQVQGLELHVGLALAVTFAAPGAGGFVGQH
jgi:hypothetical protein